MRTIKLLENGESERKICRYFGMLVSLRQYNDIKLIVTQCMHNMISLSVCPKHERDSDEFHVHREHNFELSKLGTA